MKIRVYFNDFLRDWFPLTYYRLGVARLQREHEAELKGATPDKHQTINNDYHYNLRTWNDWLQSVQDARMVKYARKMDILLEDFPFPQYDADDPHDIPNSHFYYDDFGEKLLCKATRDLLREKIRERKPAFKKERREERQFWINSVISIVGALTGLIAVWHGSGK